MAISVLSIYITTASPIAAYILGPNKYTEFQKHAAFVLLHDH